VVFALIEANDLFGPYAAVSDQFSGSSRLIDDRPVRWAQDGFALGPGGLQPK